MKTMKTMTQVIDAHDWMRALRLEYFRVADIRNLRVGEQFWIAYFAGPGVMPDIDGHCECFIERVKGEYRFNAIWTVRWGKPKRAHIMTFGSFNLLTGNKIEFKSLKDIEAETSFRKVCRYSEFISRHAKEYGLAPMYIGAPEHRHKLWRGTTILKDGLSKDGVEGPEVRGLGAIIETAMALGIVPSDENTEETEC